MSLAQAAAHFVTKSSGTRRPSHAARPIDNAENAPPLHKRVTGGVCAAARKRRGASSSRASAWWTTADPASAQGRCIRAANGRIPLRASRRSEALPPTGKTFRRQRLDHLKPLDDFPRAELRPHHHRHPRTALHAASERPLTAVMDKTMRSIGYPQIGCRINLRTSNSSARDPGSAANAARLASMNKI